MSTTQEAADAVKVLVNQHRALLVIGDALDRVASLEQAESEAKAARDKAISDRDEALADLATTRAGITSAQDAVNTATQQASALAIQASLDADQIRASGSRDADVLVRQAEQRAADLDAAITEKQVTLSVLNQSVATARVDLGDLTAKVAAIKDQFKALVS